MSVHGLNLTLANGNSQLAQIPYRSGKPVNGPFQIDLNTIIRSAHPNIKFFRFRELRVAFRTTESGNYSGWLKIIFNEGNQTSVPTSTQATALPGFVVPSYLFGHYIPLPRTYIDKWYSLASNELGSTPLPSGISSVPMLSMTIQDGTERSSILNNAATFFLVYSLAMSSESPMDNLPVQSGGGGVSTFAFNDPEFAQLEETKIADFSSDYETAKARLKSKMKKAQDMLKEEILSGQTPSTFGLLAVDKTSVLQPVVPLLEARDRTLSQFDTGYHQASINYRIELGSLPLVVSALNEYRDIQFKEFIITITPVNINNSGSHCSVTPFFDDSEIVSESQVIWYRQTLRPYRFVWNRYQPGPFTPFPYLYLDKIYNGKLDSPFPAITLQFSGWVNSSVMNIFIDYKIAMSNKRPDSTSQESGGITTFSGF